MTTPHPPKPASQWAGLSCRHATEDDRWSLTCAQAQLPLFEGWSVQTSAQGGVAQSLWRRWQPGNFDTVKQIVNAVCQLADQEDHHPDVQFSYGHVEVHWSTHSASGVSDNDWVCAAKLDQMITGLQSLED